ncbi:MAG: response regulator transcription factor [Bryobacteraceae bacterium]
MAVRIIVVTDEPLVELGIRSLCMSSPGIQLVSVEGDHEQAISGLKRERPQLVLYGLSGETDLNRVRDLLRASPQTCIILWARDISAEFAHQAVSLGVRGFISMHSPVDCLVECIETVARGELWMEQSLTVSLLNRRPVQLSRRQSQLLQLLVQGLKNKEIARALGISEGTVKAYLTTLFEKVGARDRFELALFGLKTVGLHAAGSNAMTRSELAGAPETRTKPMAPSATLRSVMARQPDDMTPTAPPLRYRSGTRYFGD